MIRRIVIMIVGVVFATQAHLWARQGDPLIFTADLTGKHVAPEAVETAAAAKATGVLVGHRFIVHGSFTGLSSPLRDLEKTPNDPGVHLHRGAVAEVTKYFYGLRVKLDADGRSGIFWGETTLDAEQVKLLLESRVYVDIHTVKHGPGEVRDQWHPAEAAKAAALLRSLGGHPSAASLEPGACHQ